MLTVMNNIPVQHVHIDEIPKKFIRRGTRAESFKNDLLRLMRALQYTNKKVQHAGQICSFNIASITRKSGYGPYPPDVYEAVEKFVYHYEHFCYLIFSFREKILHFINAVLPAGYVEHDVNIKTMIINPKVKDAKLLSLIKLFDSSTTTSPMGKLVKDRNSLTHKLYYGQVTDHLLRPLQLPEITDEASLKEWCKKWNKEITDRTKLCNAAEMQMYEINHELSAKIIKYKT